ncbi:AT-rich interactive domain-containing protein 3B [Erinaceus europaeus]|uniref:AT-rich interactive domain-containing protein 3 n=1 Tax=Erinaceus europaeus TaxID=9365 RepID=A0ABM3W0Y6_ERIEU|nr:AT-rich interactive domain-containing protein 3B [Erinaceus europaeus]XP_060030233.1 AT-rich interactive domain-containing protein 3B [Erinaceus europaeus]
MEPRPQPPTRDGLQVETQEAREVAFLPARKYSPLPARPLGSRALDVPAARACDGGAVSSEPEEEEEEEEEEEDGALGDEEDGAEVCTGQVAAPFLQTLGQDPRGTPRPPPHPLRAREDPARNPTKAPPGWSLDQQLKQNGAHAWSEEADGRGREVSRDFAKLYQLDADPGRKLFLDDLFVFMQKRGTPISRIPIMAKQTLDLYLLYKLVTDKGGLVEVINRKLWREVTKGLSLPTSITSAAFTLRTQYMKYLYAYECERKALSSPAELQAAIDGNRREGRRPSYSSPLLGSPPAASALLAAPKARGPGSGLTSSSPRVSPAAALRTGDGVPSSQQPGSRVEQPLDRRLRPPAEPRPAPPAFKRGLLGVATPLPLRIRLNGRAEDRAEPAALSLAPGGVGRIGVSLDIDGTTYTGVLFAQKPVVHLLAGTAPPVVAGPSPRCSAAPPASRGAEPPTSWSL